MKLILIIIFNIISIQLFAQTGWIQQNTNTASNITWIQFINTNTGFACGSSGVFLKTSNGGTNWINSVINTSNFKMIQFLDAQTGFVSGDSGIVRTTNQGLNWISVYSGQDGMFSHFTDINNGIKAGNSIGITTNGGINWQNNYGFPPGGITGIYYFNGANIYCSGWDWIMHLGGLYTARINKSVNGGLNWSYQYSSTMDVCCSATQGIYFTDQNTGFAVGYERAANYFYKTTNSGSNWSKQTTPSRMYSTMFVNGNTGWICGELGNVYYTENSGNNFYLQNTNVSVTLRKIFMLNKDTGFAAGDNGTILKTFNGGITGLIQSNSEIPNNFSLSQNYPNPFNPVTKIKFDISGRSASQTLLSVYDLLGHEVARLVNQQLQPGSYAADWDASAYPSGVYYYKLKSGSFTETKKMVLIK